MQHHCSACEMEIAVKAPGSAKHLKLFVRTRKCQPKVLCNGRLRSQQTPLQSRPILHSRHILHSVFCPMLPSELTCCCLYHTRPESHISSTSSLEGGRSSTEEHNSGNEHMGHWQACLQRPPLGCSVLQKPHLPQSTRKGESTAASTYSNGT